MSEKFLVTCIIVTYKKFEYFYQALDSLLMQDYPNIELIITDDGSPNFPREEIINYLKINSQKNISNLIINQNPVNLGIVKNLNTALKLSNGKYIVLLAGDDLYYEQRTISKIVEFFQNNNYLIATGYRDVYTEDMAQLICREPQDIKWTKYNSEKLYKTLSLGNFISGSSTYFTREFIEQYGYFDEAYLHLEDYPKYLSITKQGCLIGFFNFPVIKYRSGGMSTYGSLNPILKNDLKLAIETELLNNKEYLGKFLSRRIKFHIEKTFYKINKFQKYILALFYLDIIIFNKVSNFIKKIP